MATAWEIHLRPDPLKEELEEHSWDWEVYHLQVKDEVEQGLQAELYRADTGIRFWKLSGDEQDRLFGLLTECQSYPKAVTRFLEETEGRRAPMAMLKRKRYPKIDLIARYRCVVCKRTKKFTVTLRPYSNVDPYPCLFGRPTEYHCCGQKADYEGFVRRK